MIFAISIASLFGGDWFKFELVYDCPRQQRRAIMKNKFRKWLISLNCEGVNSLGVDEIVSRVDDELRVVRANEQERIVLDELISEFKC